MFLAADWVGIFSGRGAVLLYGTFLRGNLGETVSALRCPVVRCGWRCFGLGGVRAERAWRIRHGTVDLAHAGWFLDAVDLFHQDGAVAAVGGGPRLRDAVSSVGSRGGRRVFWTRVSTMKRGGLHGGCPEAVWQTQLVISLWYGQGRVRIRTVQVPEGWKGKKKFLSRQKNQLWIENMQSQLEFSKKKGYDANINILLIHYRSESRDKTSRGKH